MTRFGRLAMVARWKPVHRGHAAVLRALCANADQVVIGIGSSNRYDLRNPFTADETEAMVRLVVGAREAVEIVHIPDLDDGPRWRDAVLDRVAPLDGFVTANPWVKHLMEPLVPVLRPVEFVPVGERLAVDGTRVREELARGDGWRELVPVAVARYMVEHGLPARFRSEFGLETLARCAP